MNQECEKINILVTLDRNYIPYLNVMLSSLIHTNQEVFFDVYWLQSSISEEDTVETSRILGSNGRLILVNANEVELEDAPTSSRYPKEIYYRIFAAKYLPHHLDRILYLDPDIIVNGDIRELYHLPMEEYFFAAASHTGLLITTFNSLRLDMDDNSPYINSGVMLMNLDLLRKEQNFDDVFRFIKKRKALLMLPDQDIISSLYGSKIYALDTYRYNMTERLFRQQVFERDLDLEWVKRHSVIIHYCGRNKPWKENYSGQLDIFYKEAVSRMK
ncbi:MAG: glycosyltransferase family 8 protein [Faecousia sp.]